MATGAGRLLARLDADDRRLLLRLSLDEESRSAVRRAWIAVTHLGSAPVVIGVVLLPLLLEPWPRAATWPAALSLLLSHLVVQVLKRSVRRDRPFFPGVIASPDKFSLPSGHATSSLAVALGYSVMFPSLAVPLVGVALLVGWSRVALGVHYPGDVAVGQLIATGSVLVSRLAL